MTTPNPVNIFEYEELAKKRLNQRAYDSIAGGATDEITLRRTRAVFDSIMLKPRMMVDISQRDLSTTVLGHENQLAGDAGPSGQPWSSSPGGRAGNGQGRRGCRHGYGSKLRRIPYPGRCGSGRLRTHLVPTVLV